jgi:FixJ family two-component response regulator
MSRAMILYSETKIVAVVDDDAFVLASMGKLIRSLGYGVELFPGGASLLEQDLQRFACVVSDLQMPEMSGLALQDKLKGVAPMLPVLILTAFPDEWARSHALAAGAFGFFEKPCDLDELVAKLEEAVARPSLNG